MQNAVHSASHPTGKNDLTNLLSLEWLSTIGPLLTLRLFKRLHLWQRQVNNNHSIHRLIKSALVAAMLIGGVCCVNSLQAQVFTERTGNANPANGYKFTENWVSLSFADTDNDGDQDMVMGFNTGWIDFVSNDGTAQSPYFTQRNSFYYALSGDRTYSQPFLVDINNDGYKDMFSGSYDGTIYYFPNLGKTPYSIPKFPGTPIDVDPLPGYTNPFEAIGIPQYSRVSFADIDADGDFDAFIGHNYNYGGLKYFKNTGTAASPMFEEQTGSAALPISLGSLTNPARQAMAAFGDLNRDGRLDVLFGLSNGQIKYFTNVGTASSPRFSEMTGTKNPLSGYSFIQMQALAPSLVDIDKDGDLDLFVGVYGGIRYFENTAAPLPVVWKDFSVQQQGSGVLLKWATQQEQQTKDFVAQHSTDGINWTTIGTVKAAGNSALAKEYQYLHATAATGINYYRLLQRDIDDQSAVSAVRNIRLQGALAGFTASVQGNQLLLQVREPMELSLLNAQGAVLRKSRFATGYQQLDMSQYPAGVYFVLGNGQTSRIVRQ